MSLVPYTWLRKITRLEVFFFFSPTPSATSDREIYMDAMGKGLFVTRSKLLQQSAETLHAPVSARKRHELRTLSTKVVNDP